MSREPADTIGRVRAGLQRGRARIRTVPGTTLLLAGLILLLCVRVDSVLLTETAAQNDALQNVSLGFGMAAEGSLSMDDGLTMYREPLPIFLIAAQLRLDPRLDGVSWADLAEEGASSKYLKQINLLWVALLLVGASLQLSRLLPRAARRIGIPLGLLLVHAVAVEPFVDANLTELPAAALLVLAGLAAQSVVSGRGWVSAGLLGALLGLAALTKASLLYVGIVFLVVIAVLALLREGRRVRPLLAAVGVALVVMGLVVAPWSARNATHFGTWSIADRGGLSLWYRAVYEDATPYEIRGSWYYFSPRPLQPTMARVLDVRPEDLDGPLRRVHVLHPDEREERLSFYYQARNGRSGRSQELRAMGDYTWSQSTVIADHELLTRGLDVMRRDPVMFLRTTPLFLWRGTWAVKSAPAVPVPILALLNPLGMLLLLGSAVGAVVRLRPEYFAVVGLPAGVVGFSALLTMYEPRFSEPALPTMMILVSVGAAHLLTRVGNGLRSDGHPQRPSSTDHA